MPDINWANFTLSSNSTTITASTRTSDILDVLLGEYRANEPRARVVPSDELAAPASWRPMDGSEYNQRWGRTLDAEAWRYQGWGLTRNSADGRVVVDFHYGHDTLRYLEMEHARRVGMTRLWRGLEPVNREARLILMEFNPGEHERCRLAAEGEGT